MLTLAETGEAVPKDWELVTFEPHLEDGIQPHHLYLNLTTADPVTGEPTRVIVPAGLSMDIELLGQKRGSPTSLLSDAAQETNEDPDALEKGKQSALQKEKKEAREKELEKKEAREKELVPGAKVHGDAILRRAKPSPEGAGYFPAFRRDMKLSQDEQAVVLCMDKTTTASFIRSGARNRHTVSRIRDIDQLLRRRQEEKASAEKSIAETEGEGGALDATDDAVTALPSPASGTAHSVSPVQESGRKGASPIRESLGRTIELLKRLDGPDPNEVDVLDAPLFSLPPSAVPERRTKKGPVRSGPVRWIDPHLGKAAPTQRLHGNWPTEIRRRLARNYYDYEAPRKRSPEKAAGSEKEKEPATPAKKSKEKPSPVKKPEGQKKIVGVPEEPFRLEVMVHSGKGRIVVGHKQPPKWRDRLAVAGA